MRSPAPRSRREARLLRAPQGEPPRKACNSRVNRSGPHGALSSRTSDLVRLNLSKPLPRTARHACSTVAEGAAPLSHCPVESSPDLGPPGRRGYLPRHTNAVGHAPSYLAGWGRALTAARPLGANLDWPPPPPACRRRRWPVQRRPAATATTGPPGLGDPLTTLCGRWGAAAGHSAKDGPFEHDERRSAAKRPKWDQLLC